MLSRRLLAVVCLAAITAASTTLIATHVTAQSNANVGDCARANESVVLASCSNFFTITGACAAGDGRAFRITGWESNGYYRVRHLLASGYIAHDKIDWAAESYCQAAGIPR